MPRQFHRKPTYRPRQYLRLEHVRVERITDLFEACTLLQTASTALARLGHPKEAQTVRDLIADLQNVPRLPR